MNTPQVKHQQPPQKPHHANVCFLRHTLLSLLLLYYTMGNIRSSSAMEMPVELMNMIAASHTPNNEENDQQQQLQPIVAYRPFSDTLEMLSDVSELVELPPLLHGDDNSARGQTATVLGQAAEQELQQADDAMSKYKFGKVEVGGEVLSDINDERPSIDENIAEAKWLLQQQKQHQHQQQQQRIINEAQQRQEHAQYHQQQQQQHNANTNNIAYVKTPLKQKQRKPTAANAGGSHAYNDATVAIESRTCYVRIQRKLRGICRAIPMGNACIAGDYVDMSDDCE